MDGMADVSVIIPAFNAAGFIDRALSSAVGQTLPPREIIVVDDESKDDTVQVVERFAVQHPSVTVLRLTPNGGPSGARNAGIRKAKGTWIAILDADDAFKPDRLEKMIEAASRFDAQFISDNQILFDASAFVEVRPGFAADWDMKALTLKDVFDNDLPDRSPLDFALLKPVVQRAFLIEHGIAYDEQERNGEDFKFMTDILFAGARAVLISHPGYIYSTRFGQVSRQQSSATRSVSRFDRLVELSDILENKYAHLINDDLRLSIRRRRRHLALIHDSNVAREFRLKREFARYAAYVLARPSLLTMLAERVARKLLNRPRHRAIRLVGS